MDNPSFASNTLFRRFELRAKVSLASRTYEMSPDPACLLASGQAVHLLVRISKRPCLIEKAATPLDWLSIYKLEKVTQRPDTSRVTSSPHSKAYAKGHSCRDHSDRKSGRELPIARCFRQGATQRMTMPATLHICQYLHHSLSAPAPFWCKASVWRSWKQGDSVGSAVVHFPVAHPMAGANLQPHPWRLDELCLQAGLLTKGAGLCGASSPGLLFPETVAPMLHSLLLEPRRICTGSGLC